jgi:hypothetical protein
MYSHAYPMQTHISPYKTKAPRPLRMLFRKQSDRPAAEKMVLDAGEVSSNGIRVPAKKAPGVYPGFPSQPPPGGPMNGPFSSPYSPHVGVTSRIGEMPSNRGGYRPGQASPLANLGSMLGDKLNELIREVNNINEPPKSMPPPPPWQQQQAQQWGPNQAGGYNQPVGGGAYPPSAGGGPYGNSPGQTAGYQSYGPPVGVPNRAQNGASGFGAQYQFPADIIPPSGTKMTTKVMRTVLYTNTCCVKTDVFFFFFFIFFKTRPSHGLIIIIIIEKKKKTSFMNQGRDRRVVRM